MPPYNVLLGHLPFVYKITSQLPSDAHPNYLPDMVRRALPELGPVYYLDTWPFGPQMLVVATVDTLRQITQEHSLPKYHALRDFLRPIADGLDLVTMEGQAWKTWRGIFNPGFSAKHLTTLTAGVVEETSRFCDLLLGHASSSRTINMKKMTDFLALDIIGRVVLYVACRVSLAGADKHSDVRLESQVQSNPLVDGLRSQIHWLIFGGEANPLARLHPLRPFALWYNTRRMNRYVLKALDDRMADLPHEKGTKTILDLALSAYVAQDEEPLLLQRPDDTFRNFAMNQVKLFLFSGHDTTSSSMCYLFYVLATDSASLCKVRAEHDRVFGEDDKAAASRIVQTPALLNQIPYTLAVIKETLRLYPTVSSARAGEEGFSVVDEQGRRYPTDGFLIWANSQAVHRDPQYWPRADDFLPDRWLVSSDHPWHPVKGAWRPFEHGPRNCLGQELAMMEMKIVLVMTARTFCFDLMYDPVDQQRLCSTAKTIYGERGYQIQRAQPKDNLPIRVRRLQG